MVTATEKLLYFFLHYLAATDRTFLKRFHLVFSFCLRINQFLGIGGKVSFLYYMHKPTEVDGKIYPWITDVCFLVLVLGNFADETRAIYRKFNRLRERKLFETRSALESLV